MCICTTKSGKGQSRLCVSVCVFKEICRELALPKILALDHTYFLFTLLSLLLGTLKRDPFHLCVHACFRLYWFGSFGLNEEEASNKGTHHRTELIM